MEFYIGDTLQISGENYRIVGRVKYKNPSDNCCWDEYRLIVEGSEKERWLSYDEAYQEYSISEAIRTPDTEGYHVVDQGTEVVVGAWGNVDVEAGDRASFVEYEDPTEEFIRSTEVWEDETEYSSGYYLDPEEIRVIHRQNGGGDNSFISGNRTGGVKKKSGSVLAIVIILCSFFSVFGGAFGAFFSNSVKISKYLEENTQTFTYATSVTGKDGEKADVYESNQSLDATAKMIINAIEGDTADVQQNTEDGDESVAILTDKEYCLVYTSEDDKIFVQVSSRKYTYQNDNSLYRARSHTNRYYRRYYYSRGYTTDSTSYDSTSSPYSHFDDATITYNDSDTYRTYSSTVRQQSAARRSSSGGGLSSGK